MEYKRRSFGRVVGIFVNFDMSSFNQWAVFEPIIYKWTVIKDIK